MPTASLHFYWEDSMSGGIGGTGVGREGTEGGRIGGRPGLHNLRGWGWLDLGTGLPEASDGASNRAPVVMQGAEVGGHPAPGVSQEQKPWMGESPSVGSCGPPTHIHLTSPIPPPIPKTSGSHTLGLPPRQREYASSAHCVCVCVCGGEPQGHQGAQPGDKWLGKQTGKAVLVQEDWPRSPGVAFSGAGGRRGEAVSR